MTSGSSLISRYYSQCGEALSGANPENNVYGSCFVLGDIQSLSLRGQGSCISALPEPVPERRVCSSHLHASIVWVFVRGEPLRSAHFNYLELLTVKLVVLVHFLLWFQNQHVLVQMDNTTVVALVKREGGPRFRRLHNLAKQSWFWSAVMWLSLRATCSTASQFRCRPPL